MFRYAEIVWEDGWTRRHDRGFLLRRNPAHIQRVLRAIEQRYERDSDMRLDPPTLKDLMQ
jgi:hypothetical protein